MKADLRERLGELGLSLFDVVLPDEEADASILEGALRLRRDERLGYVVETVDYGQGFQLGVARTEADAESLLLAYVSRRLSPIRVVTSQELDRLSGAVAVHYFDLRDRATEAGTAGIVIDLPADLPVDRFGALDGVHLYPLDTPFELRSLPPQALLPQTDVRRFLTAAPIRVHAAITPPWFGRPGGGLRFTLQAPATGIRDLVVSGTIRRIQVA